MAGTIPADENEFPKVLFAEGAAPSTPATGLVVVYAKSDGLMYFKDDAGTEYPVSQAADLAAHLADTTDAHDASAVSVLDTAAVFTATNVETALKELYDAIGAGGIPATIIDAKGDVIAGTAADTAARLAVGSNDHVLTAASGETTGLKWATPKPDATEAYITSPVTVVNADTWYAGPTLTTPAAGTYLVIARLVMSSSFNGVTSCSGGIGTGGTPTVASGQVYVPAQNNVITIPLVALFTVNGSQDIIAYGLSARGSSVVSILDTATSGAITDKASNIVAFQVV